MRKVQTMGSPPHTRGKVVYDKLYSLRQRITPAHAGKSSLSALQRMTKQGSPPHTRGKAWEILAGLITIGITPAHAGKSELTIAATAGH